MTRLRIRDVLAALMCLALLGCTLGPGRYRQEAKPNGAYVEVELAGESLRGELLAVDDEGLDFHVAGRIRRAAWREIDELEVEQFDDLGTRDRRPPGHEQLERLRLLSRFPQGMSSEIRGALEGRPRTSTLDPGAFLAVAQAAAERYADPERAIADGFTRVGPETAEMGEHWVRWGTIARGIFDPGRPAILVYATRGGSRQIAGVAYALALGPGESPPEPPAGAHWHPHDGTVAEELAAVHAPSPGGDDAAGARVVVIHAWTHADNPAGPFESENPALPAWRNPPLTAGAD